MLTIVHGRLVKPVGRRFIAVRDRKPGLADRIAAQSNIRGNWDRVMTTHKYARVILNYR